VKVNELDETINELGKTVESSKDNMPKHIKLEKALSQKNDLLIATFADDIPGLLNRVKGMPDREEEAAALLFEMGTQAVNVTRIDEVIGGLTTLRAASQDTSVKKTAAKAIDYLNKQRKHLEAP
jgi:hypothetical protein